MQVYRGFGACVFGDWDWGCPDIAYLEEKARKRAIRTFYGIKQKVDAQPTRSVFLAFDQVIQILQVKSIAFLARRPPGGSFAEQQARYGARPKKEVKDDIELLEDWVKQLERRGHPAPTGGRLSSWGIPFASWTSPYSCHIMKSHKDCESLLTCQMDPGRLLHAFVSRGNLNLDEGQVLLLLPRSPAESLVCWLQGLPGTTHKIIKWQDLETEYLEKKISKSLRKKLSIGRYPLPTQFAIKDPDAVRPPLATSISSPAVLGNAYAISPPAYSPSASELHNDSSRRQVAELGSPDARELSGSPATASPSVKQSASSRSIHKLRRLPAASTMATAPPSRTGSAATGAPSSIAAIELPENTAASKSPTRDTPSAVELPTDFQEEAPKGLAMGVGGPAEDKKAAELPATDASTASEPSQPARLAQPPEPSHSVGATSLTAGAETTAPSETTTSPETIAPSESIAPSETTAAPVRDIPGDTAETSTETQEAQTVTDKQMKNVNDQGPSDPYLELLKKVASGEISPQALSQMLETSNG